MLNVPHKIITVIESINSKGYDAFLVGGWVRDALLGHESFDVDITTNADTASLMALFSAHHPKTHALNLGSVSFQLDAYSIEITQYRKESHYEDFRRPSQVEFVDTLEEDLARRDFTINALCYHPSKGLIDLYGGQDDLSVGILKCIGDPELKFSQDALRILRLYRFKSQLGFSIDSNTHTASMKYLANLQLLSIHEWKHEFYKLITGRNFLNVAMEDHLIFEVLIPELKEAFNFDQLNPYHCYSLYEHSMRVSADLPAEVGWRLVGIFHDLGKLRTQVIDDDGIGHYRTHAAASAVIAKAYFKEFQIKKSHCESMLNLIEFHDVSLKENLESIYHFAFRYGVAFTEDLIELKRSDNKAKSEKAHYQISRCDAFESLLKDASMLPLEVKDLQIKNQVVLEFGVAQNSVSKVLNKVLEGVVEANCGHDKAKQYAILEGVVHHDIY